MSKCEECERIGRKCAKCRKAYAKSYRKRKRQERYCATEEKNIGNRKDVKSKGRQQVAEELGMANRYEVEKIEQDALLKIRKNPELRELWDKVKSGQIEFDGTIFDLPKIFTRDLMDRLVEMIEWRATYEELAANDETKTDAAEMLVEIERSSKLLDAAINEAIVESTAELAKPLKK